MRPALSTRPSLRALLIGSGLLLASSLGSAQQIGFAAVMSGGEVVPPVVTSAGATAAVLMDLDANTLTYDLTHFGLGATELSASLHGYAPPGATGPVLASLPLGFHKSGVWNYPPADEAQILASLAYLQISSSSFPGGELRGQLLRDSSPASMSAALDGLQSVPPTPSSARGTAYCQVDTLQNKFKFSITFEGINSAQTAAHIHGPAGPGQTNSVKFNLPLGAGNHLVGIWDYDQADEADILAGLMYINVHSTQFPSAEIRGQILPLASNPTTYCTAKTTSLGCTPAISASGVPSVSAPTGFVITSAPVPGGNPGIFFYSKSGPAALPFQGAVFCVQSPILRTPASSAGGNQGQCNGAYAIDFNSYMAGGTDPALVAGATVFLQTWFRDPPDPVSGTGLSNAVMFTIRL